MASQEYTKLAQSLPPTLLRFFARYSPTTAQFSNRAPAPLPQPTTSKSLPSHNIQTETSLSTSIPSLPSLLFLNPFERHKHPVTGRWHDPAFSLRRQADLVKLARANGVEELLPFTVKGTEERIRRREETGLRVKGTGVGQKVKGKIWERTQKGRLEKRRQAMLGMPALVQKWKQVIYPEISKERFC